MKNTNQPLRYFMYARKSTESEERQAMSIPAQRERMAELFGHLDVVEVLVEHASAFNPGRPVFNDMIKRIQAGEADGIVAWHPDRLARNEIDAGTMTYLLRLRAIKDFKFVSFTFMNSPEGIMMLQQALCSSQYFSAKLSQDVRRGMTHKAQLGWKPSMAATGYLNVTEGKLRTIVKDPERFVLIQKAWRLLLSGSYSVPEILKKLNDEWGFRTMQRKKNGGKPLARSALYFIFTNPFYAGVVEYDGKVYNGLHEKMITMEEFNNVQAMLGAKGKPRKRVHDHAFTGLIRCGECDCFVTAATKTKRIQANNTTRSYTYYSCTHRKVGHPCAQPSITVQQLESQINDLLEKIEILPDFEKWALDVVRSQHEREQIARKAIRKNVEASLRKAEKKGDQLVDMRCKSLMSDSEYTWHRNRLEKEVIELQQQRDGVDHRFQAWIATTERAIGFGCHAAQAFKTGDNKTKRNIVRTIGTEFILKDKTLAVKPQRWIKVLMDDEQATVGVNGTSEPEKKPDGTGQKPIVEGSSSRWSSTLDAIRTALKDPISPIFIADLKKLNNRENTPHSHSLQFE